MREWCSCGAAIRASRSDVLEWRHNHQHDANTSPVERETELHALVEHAGSRYFESETIGHDIPIIHSRTGFQPND